MANGFTGESFCRPCQYTTGRESTDSPDELSNHSILIYCMHAIVNKNNRTMMYILDDLHSLCTSERETDSSSFSTLSYCPISSTNTGYGFNKVLDGVVQMGKAGKWLINFLLGRKEEKEKKKLDASSYEIHVATPTVVIPSTPNPYRKRWSFGKSSRNEGIHKGRKSVDSIINPFITHVSSSLEQDKRQKIDRALAMPWTATDRKRKMVGDAAATMIQAAFRSFLAKKALKALRGLVKLQALVRGHHVRKQTNATLRKIQALMAIQVRARFQRIQMTEESNIVSKSQSARHRRTVDARLYEGQEVSKNKYWHKNDFPMKRPTKFYSGELPILKQEHKYEIFPTAQNIPHAHSPASEASTGRASFTYDLHDYYQPASNPYCIQPHYMENTQSSRAKVRSQSEPKQRPKESIKSKSKRVNSTDGTNVQHDARSQCSSVHSKKIDHEEQDPWFIELCRSRRLKDGNHDTTGVASSDHSNYNRFLITYEMDAEDEQSEVKRSSGIEEEEQSEFRCFYLPVPRFANPIVLQRALLPKCNDGLNIHVALLNISSGPVLTPELGLKSIISKDVTGCCLHSDASMGLGLFDGPSLTHEDSTLHGFPESTSVGSCLVPPYVNSY